MFNILERMQPKPVDTTPLAVRELGCMLSALVRLGELHAHIASAGLRLLKRLLRLFSRPVCGSGPACAASR
jgi:hypothetical protein